MDELLRTTIFSLLDAKNEYEQFACIGSDLVIEKYSKRIHLRI